MTAGFREEIDHDHPDCDQGYADHGWNINGLFIDD